MTSQFPIILTRSLPPKIGFVALLCLCFTTVRSVYANGEINQPNILFILVDDLGKEWIRCYGAENMRPSIDELAAGGMKFNNAWCMPQCTPTRVTLLTGQYPFRHGWTNHWDVPRWGAGASFDPNLNTSYADLLRALDTRPAGWQMAN